MTGGVAPVPQGAPVAPVESSLSSPAVAVRATQPEPDTMVDGACGITNGLAAEAKPAMDLCAQGEATSVLGTGPWRWSCKGRRGGMTVSCAAPAVAPSDKSKEKAGSGNAGSESDSLLQVGQCGRGRRRQRRNTHSQPLRQRNAKSRQWFWAVDMGMLRQ